MNSCELKKTAGLVPTPLYVFDLDEFDKRIALIKEHLGDRADFCYAMKANPFLLERADRSANKFEVCSPGEFELCEKAGIAPEKIVYSGVYKDPASTGKVIGRIAGRGIATIESPAQAVLLDKCAEQAGTPADVIIRIALGSQFGIDKEEACRIIQNRKDFQHLRIKGFQMYTGTQKKKLRTIEKELEKLDSLIARCEDEYGFRTVELEYGPGLPVNYFEDDSFDEEGMLTSFCSLLDQLRYTGHKCIEMGRFAAASCGYYMTSAADLKTNNGQNIIITDGGSHQMKYYGQNMGMRIPFYEHLRGDGASAHTDDSGIPADPASAHADDSGIPADSASAHADDSGIPADPASAPSSWDLYGALCTVHDVIVRDLPLTDVRPGDIFVFKNTGAYSVTEGMALFLSRDLPPVLTYDRDGGIKVLRKRISAADLNCIRAEDIPANILSRT